MGRTGIAFAMVLLIGLITDGPSFAQDANCLRIGSPFAGKQTVYDAIESNLRGVLATLNLCMEIVAAPPKRLAEEFQQGSLDGELVRVPAYVDAAGGVAVLVEEPLIEIRGDLVVQSDIDLSETSIESLYIGILRGVKWQDAAATGARGVIVANDMEQLLPMFLNRRVDGIMIGQTARQQYPSLHQLPSKVAFETTGHFILHRSRAALAPSISAAIEAYKQRGCFFMQLGGGSRCASSGGLLKMTPEEQNAALSAVLSVASIKVGFLP